MNLRGLIREALLAMGVDAPFIEIEIPKDESHGDLSTPVAMVLARERKSPPREIASDIKERLDISPMVEKVEIAGPGFINFFLSRRFLHEELARFLLAPASWLRRDLGGGRRIQVEFVSANPTGPLHLGHGRGAAVGSALSSLLAAAGFSIEKEFYVNDAGRQVRLLGESVFARYLELCGRDMEFPEDGYRGDYVWDIARRLYEQDGQAHAGLNFDDVAERFIDTSYRLMLEEIKRDLLEFGVSFDSFQSERELFSRGDVDLMIESLRKQGHSYDRDGAVWFKSTIFGDDKDRVIVKSDGSYTYFASDIAYHYLKSRRGFDELINVWGADHHGYIPRVRAALEAFGYDPTRLRVLLVQMVTLMRGGKPVQMSKRAGEFITLREVMEEVGTDASRFTFLTRRQDSHLEFDLEVLKQQSSENPVFYVQYALARIKSVFKKAEEEGYAQPSDASASLASLVEDDEVRLMKKIIYYPMVFEGAVQAREPHRITYYLQELAGIFHPYYNKHRIVGDDPELSKARLALCRAILLVISEGLTILGISLPERM